MKDFQKKLSIIIIVFLSCVSANQTVVLGSDEIDTPMLNQMTIREILDTYKTNQERMIKVIWKLQHESTKENLKRLDEYSLYDWPVGAACRKDSLLVEVPLPPSYDMEDVKLILNNRRYAKLAQDLAALSKKEAAALINKELPLALKTYDKLYESYFKNCRKGKVHGLAMSHKDKSSTLLGMKYKVLSLTMLAGQLELHETEAQIQNVLDYAIGQRDTIYNEIHKDADAMWIINQTSLYNRIILGTSVLRIFATPEKARIILNNSGLKYHTAKLLPYDYLPLQPYSFTDLFLVDEKKGQFSFSYLEPIDDSKFGLLLLGVMRSKQGQE